MKFSDQGHRNRTKRAQNRLQPAVVRGVSHRPHPSVLRPNPKTSTEVSTLFWTHCFQASMLYFKFCLYCPLPSPSPHPPDRTYCFGHNSHFPVVCLSSHVPLISSLPEKCSSQYFALADAGEEVVAHVEALHDRRLRVAVDEAIRETEKREAERRSLALGAARKTADNEIEELKRKLAEEQQRAVNEERRRTTEEMERQAEQLLSEASERLKEALRKAADEAHARQLQAVKEGRADELRLAEQRAEKAAEEAQRRLERAEAKKDEQRRVALEDLTKQKEEERIKAVENGKREQAEEDARELASVRAGYESQLSKVYAELNNEKRLRDDAEADLA